MYKSARQHPRPSPIECSRLLQTRHLAHGLQSLVSREGRLKQMRTQNCETLRSHPARFHLGRLFAGKEPPAARLLTGSWDYRRPRLFKTRRRFGGG